MTDTTELFPVIDTDGNVIGKATRGECHSGSMLLHPVVHLHVLASDGRIFLQKRSDNKDIQPGKWDTAVGGHVDYGETIIEALYREASEELGFDKIDPIKLISYVFQSDREREMINVFYIMVNPRNFVPKLDPDEIQTGRFWSVSEVMNAMGKDILTPNFEHEFQRIRGYLNL